MNPLPSKPTRHCRPKAGSIILPTLVILALVLLLTGTTSAAPATSEARTPSNQMTLQQQQPLCQSCQPDEYDVWKNSTHAKRDSGPHLSGAVGQESQPGRVSEMPYDWVRYGQW